MNYDNIQRYLPSTKAATYYGTLCIIDGEESRKVKRQILLSTSSWVINTQYTCWTLPSSLLSLFFVSVSLPRLRAGSGNERSIVMRKSMRWIIKLELLLPCHLFMLQCCGATLYPGTIELNTAALTVQIAAWGGFHMDSHIYSVQDVSCAAEAEHITQERERVKTVLQQVSAAALTWVQSVCVTVCITHTHTCAHAPVSCRCVKVHALFSPSSLCTMSHFHLLSSTVAATLVNHPPNGLIRALTPWIILQELRWLFAALLMMMIFHLHRIATLNTPRGGDEDFAKLPV